MAFRRATVAFGAAALLVFATATIQSPPDEEYEEEGDLFEEPFWAEFAGKIQSSVDGGTLLRARRWGNIANGVLLGTTGPIALIISAIGLRLPHAVLAGYLAALGGTITSLELGLSPIAPWVSENLSFLASSAGRTALLGVAGGLAWAFGKPAALAALLTCGNALFNGYFAKILRFVSADEQEGGDVQGGVDQATDYQPGVEPEIDLQPPL